MNKQDAADAERAQRRDERRRRAGVDQGRGKAASDETDERRLRIGDRPQHCQRRDGSIGLFELPAIKQHEVDVEPQRALQRPADVEQQLLAPRLERRRDQ